MVNVEYQHEIPYAHDVNGKQYPRLTLRLANPADPDQALDVDAHVDSGTERSLFDGSLARGLGIDLLAGEAITLQSTASCTVAQPTVRHASVLPGEARRLSFATQ